MRQTIAILGLLALSGCVSYHAVGTPEESRYGSNLDCAWQASDSGGGAIIAAFPFGALGGAIVGAAVAAGQSGSPQDRQAAHDACMAQHGWQRD